MKETKYIRNGKNIRSVAKKEDGTPVERFDFKSINAAKRKSRELQMENDRGLGLGSVRVA